MTASTRNPAKAERLRALGAEPVVVDGLDAAAVGEAVARAEPEVVIHQMTSLAGVLNLRRFDRAFAVTNQLRTAGHRPPARGRLGRGRPAVHRAELHRLDQHPRGRPGEDRG